QIAWQRPLMYVENSAGEHIATDGHSLEEIAAGAIPDIPLSEANYRSSLSKLFFEARLKAGYLEIRSVDGLMGSARMAAAALWTGLLYSPRATENTIRTLGEEMSAQVRTRLWLAASQDGLKGQTDGWKVNELARFLVEQAK